MGLNTHSDAFAAQLQLIQDGVEDLGTLHGMSNGFVKLPAIKDRNRRAATALECNKDCRSVKANVSEAVATYVQEKV